MRLCGWACVDVCVCVHRSALRLDAGTSTLITNGRVVATYSEAAEQQDPLAMVTCLPGLAG